MRLIILPARAGAQWVAAGARTFWRRPIAMTGLFFMFIAALSLLAVIPLVGAALALILVPAMTVGLMAAAHEVDQGRFPMPAMLFTALQQGPARTRAMLLLGVLYALAALLVLALSALFDEGRFAQLYVGGGHVTQEMAQDPRLMTSMWVSALLYLPISLTFWHAPALIHWHGVPMLKSLFFSLVAVLRNARAFLVYGALWALLSSVIGLAAALLLTLTASQAGDAGFATTLLFLLSILVAAMFFCSLWFTFRDSFQQDAPGEEAASATIPPP